MLAPHAPSAIARPLAAPRAWRARHAVCTLACTLLAFGVHPALASQQVVPLEAQPTVANATVGGAVPERLGPLFYTPAERDALVRARQGEADTPLHVSRVTVNGLVKRDRGHSTAWVNGQAVEDGHSLPLAGRVGVGRARVSVNGQPLRVGESLDLMTRVRGDVVAPGAVTVKGGK